MQVINKRAPFLCALSIFSILNNPAGAALPDSHAPIGVMGDHTHKEGEWMFSHRYMTMDMAGNRDGTIRLSTEEVLRSGTGIYAVAPTEMTMEMHMLGMMYAPSNRFTLMAMVLWTKNEMDHVTAMGGSFSTGSSDLGDVSISALIPWAESSAWLVGLSLPTGDLNQWDQTPMGNALLPYPMQIGSGTYNLQLGYNINQTFDGYSLGGQAKTVIPLGKNDEGYAVGERYELTAWYGKRFGQFSWSLRGSYVSTSDYDGADPRYQMGLVNNLVPTIDTSLRAGRRMDVGLGINWVHESGLRLAVEYALPAYQRLDGPQLEVDDALTFGIQFTPPHRH